MLRRIGHNSSARTATVSGRSVERQQVGLPNAVVARATAFNLAPISVIKEVMKTRASVSSTFKFTPAQQAVQLEHLARLLDAVEHGLTGSEAAKTFLHIPSGERVRILSTDLRTQTCRAILSAATEPGDDDDEA